MTDAELDQRARSTPSGTLSIDAVQAANSWTPRHADGACAACIRADLEPSTRKRAFRIQQDPIWPGWKRPPSQLSNGHASMLLWSVLYLTRTAGRECRVRDAGQAALLPSTISGAFCRSLRSRARAS